MSQKIVDSNLERLRRYIAEEAKRLGKNGAGIVHQVDLDKVENEAVSMPPIKMPDPLERDLDLLFGPNGNSKKVS
ncbi:MAG TPA: hypothetical protein VGB30_10235 [bacterium]|jgi:hypothetical protein